MISAFLAWWFEQLRALLPLDTDGLVRARRDALILAQDGDQASLLQRRRGATSVVGRFALDAQGARALKIVIGNAGRRAVPLVLRLSANAVLRKRLTLPLAVQADLDRVLEYEMDRETPFSVSDVHWDYALRDRDRVAGKLHLELMVIPRAAMRRIEALLEAAGTRATAIELDERPNLYRWIRLGEDFHAERLIRSRALAVLGGLSAVLALVAIALPFWFQQRALDAGAEKLAALQPAAEASLKLRQDINQLAQAQGVLEQQAARAAGPLGILAAATEVIPDTTYLTDFSLRGDKLSLTGESPAAAQLIGLLAQTPPFKDPSFTSPVVRNEAGSRETFTIAVSVGRGGGQGGGS